MRTRDVSRVLVVVLALAAGLLAGCGGDSEEESANAQICAARDDIAKQVDELKGMTLTTATTDEVSAGLEAIRDDLSQIKEAQRDVSDERRDELEAANAAFTGAIQDIAATVVKSVSVEEAKADAGAALQQLASTYKSSFGQLDCP